MNEYVIETKQLTKKYGAFTALDHVNLHVKKGGIYGLIGDNGAGKSTLLKLLAGISFPTKGEVRLLGRFDEKGLEGIRKKIGCMIEQPGLFPDMTVEQTMRYYSLQKGVPERKAAEELICRTGLVSKRKSKCRTLSVGQKQRLGLAVALLGEPQILILDEPVNGLDPSGIVEIRTMLQELNEEKNMTVLLSSHILPELQQLATEYGFLSQGKLIEEISADNLLKKCSDCIEIAVSDLETYSVLFETHFPKETFKILPENKLRIYHPALPAEAYSRLASDNGVYIVEMQTIRTSLEDYYMERKKGGGDK